MELNSLIEQGTKEFMRLKKDKKLLIIGTGTIAECVINFFNINVEKDVVAFIETKPNKSSYMNKDVISIQYLNKNVGMYEDNLIVFASSAWKAISQLLNVQNRIVTFNPYEKYAALVMPLFNIRNKFKQFISIEQPKSNVVNEKKKRILIMVGEREGSTTPFHAISLAAILKLYGHEVEILFNDLSRFSNYTQSNETSYYQQKIIEEMLVYFEQQYGIPYYKLSDQEDMVLTANEQKLCNEVEYYNLVWLTKNILFDISDGKNIALVQSWKANAKKIKSYLQQRNYDKVYCWTGVHGEWGLLRVLCESIGYECFYTEYIRDGYWYSIKSPTIMQKDITYINLKNLNEQAIAKLNAIGEEHLSTLKNYANHASDDIVDFSRKTVYIPLNIFWDSASYNSEDIFLKFDKWLIETIEFLLYNCQAQVIVRQHPYERNYASGEEIKQLLLDKFNTDENFMFIDKNSDFNTYTILDKVDLILPNTSTVGIEAAMLGKNVIVKNDVYYSRLGFVQRAKTKDEYFSLIYNALNTNQFVMSEELKEKAKICYALTMENSIPAFLGHIYKDFHELINKDLIEVKEDKLTRWLIDLIEKDKFLLESKMNDY